MTHGDAVRARLNTAMDSTAAAGLTSVWAQNTSWEAVEGLLKKYNYNYSSHLVHANIQDKIIQ